MIVTHHHKVLHILTICHFTPHILGGHKHHYLYKALTNTYKYLQGNSKPRFTHKNNYHYNHEP